MCRRIIALNNAGVKHLQSGRYHEAILCFRHAMECLTSSASVSHNEPTRMFADEIVLCRTILHDMEPSLSVAVSPHNMFEVYLSAFCLPKMHLNATDDSTEISIVLFYNVGLAYQLWGLSGQQVTDACFSEALSFYKLALMLFKSQTVTRLDSLSLVLGLLCNLGHVFSHFCRVHDAKSCGAMIEHILDSQIAVQLEDEEADFFCSTGACCASLFYSPASAA